MVHLGEDCVESPRLRFHEMGYTMHIPHVEILQCGAFWEVLTWASLMKTTL